MKNKISQFISYVLHPLLIPTLTFFVLMAFLPELIQPFSNLTLPFLFFTTFVIPLLSVFILRFTGSIQSMVLMKKEERIMPFLFVALFYSLTTYLFLFKIHVNATLLLMLCSITFLIVILTVVTFWYKVSIHAAALSGVVSFLTVFGLRYPNNSTIYLLVGSVLLAGVVTSARLQLNAHTPKEILVGIIIGFVVCFSIMYWFA